MHRQLNRAIAQTEEDNSLALNELNDSLITGTPGEMSDVCKNIYIYIVRPLYSHTIYSNILQNSSI